jgi:hypothetical protein
MSIRTRQLMPAAGRGGWGQISTAIGLRYRMGSHAQIFFSRGGPLNSFLEIKEFKDRPEKFMSPFNRPARRTADSDRFIFRGLADHRSREATFGSN